MPKPGKPDDKDADARNARAKALRASIAHGANSGEPLSPLELTDEAARKAAAEARSKRAKL